MPNLAEFPGKNDASDLERAQWNKELYDGAAAGEWLAWTCVIMSFMVMLGVLGAFISEYFVELLAAAVMASTALLTYRLCKGPARGLALRVFLGGVIGTYAIGVAWLALAEFINSVVSPAASVFSTNSFFFIVWTFFATVGAAAGTRIFRRLWNGLMALFDSEPAIMPDGRRQDALDRSPLNRFTLQSEEEARRGNLIEGTAQRVQDFGAAAIPGNAAARKAGPAEDIPAADLGAAGIPGENVDDEAAPAAAETASASDADEDEARDQLCNAVDNFLKKMHRRGRIKSKLRSSARRSAQDARVRFGDMAHGVLRAYLDAGYVTQANRDFLERVLDVLEGRAQGFDEPKRLGYSQTISLDKGRRF